MATAAMQTPSAPSSALGTAAPDSNKINVLLSSFPGMGLPSTLCLQVSPSHTINDLLNALSEKLPIDLQDTRLILTTSSNKQIPFHSSEPVSSLLPSPDENILPIRLSAPLCGGKGGFGSQLRAAGGRMSAKKKRSNAEAAASSSRNLDGRRLRTVKEAKALAEYLAVKPEMDRKEKEERKKRWEAVVEAAERREEEIRAGKAGRDRGDGKWIEEKEEVEARLRDNIKEAMANGLIFSHGGGNESDESVDGSGSSASDEVVDEKGKGKAKATGRKVYGWDDEEDDDEESDDDMSDQE